MGAAATGFGAKRSDPVRAWLDFEGQGTKSTVCLNLFGAAAQIAEST